MSKYSKCKNELFGEMCAKPQIEGSVTSKGKNDQPYRLTKAIAGSDSQLKRFIKEDLDFLIETFVDEYYKVKDLIK